MDSTTTKPKFPPPAYPPPQRPLLHPQSPTPYGIDLELLAHQGWVSLPISVTDTDPLYRPFSSLFSASAQFFALPEPEKLKYRLADRAAYAASEEGYSNIPGEKCMITLRRADSTPTQCDVRARAEAAWAASAQVMRDVLARIEESLGMQPGVLVRTMGPKLEMPGEGEERVATLLRMFRYERPKEADTQVGIINGADDTANAANQRQRQQQQTSRVVAESHKDLGLLTIVVGHTPGLECWDPVADAWVACEELAGHEPGKLRASLLVGQTLAKFTNWRFQAGRHRVFVHAMPPSSSNANTDSIDAEPLLTSPTHRFSLVHALRAHYPLRVSSSSFETPITGTYTPDTQFADVSVAEIYRAISNAHWNINISVDVRREQERRLKELKDRQDAEAKAAKEGGESGTATVDEKSPDKARARIAELEERIKELELREQEYLKKERERGPLASYDEAERSSRRRSGLFGLKSLFRRSTSATNGSN